MARPKPTPPANSWNNGRYSNQWDRYYADLAAWEDEVAAEKAQAKRKPSSTFDINDPFAPTTDPHGAFGSVPKDIPLPDPHGDLANLYPNLDDQTDKLSSNIMQQLHGELSPDTQMAIQDAAARFGVVSGMPGSGLGRARIARDLGLTSQAIQQEGLKNYLAATQGISNTQTVDPGLQTQINQINSLNRAAPNPTQAASYAKKLFDEYMQTLRSPGAGTRGLNNAPAVFGGGFAGVPNAPTFPSIPTTSRSSPGATPAPPSTAGAGTGAMSFTAKTPSGGFFNIPDNWGMFSSQQQQDYPFQVDWANQWGQFYE